MTKALQITKDAIAEKEIELSELHELLEHVTGANHSQGQIETAIRISKITRDIYLLKKLQRRLLNETSS